MHIKIKYIMPTIRGLGDVVAIVAKPIAKVSDAVTGSNLKDCGECKQRQKKLNELFPL